VRALSKLGSSCASCIASSHCIAGANGRLSLLQAARSSRRDTTRSRSAASKGWNCAVSGWNQ
jgi:hypothetical protein